MTDITAICSISENLRVQPRVSTIPQSAKDLPATNAYSCSSGERYECVLIIIPKETTWAEFVGVRPVFGCGAYHYMAVDQLTYHVRLWCIASTIATTFVPLGIGRLSPESVWITQSSAASLLMKAT